MKTCWNNTKQDRPSGELVPILFNHSYHTTFFRVQNNCNSFNFHKARGKQDEKMHIRRNLPDRYNGNVPYRNVHKQSVTCSYIKNCQTVIFLVKTKGHCLHRTGCLTVFMSLREGPLFFIVTVYHLRSELLHIVHRQHDVRLQ